MVLVYNMAVFVILRACVLYAVALHCLAVCTLHTSHRLDGMSPMRRSAWRFIITGHENAPGPHTSSKSPDVRRHKLVWFAFYDDMHDAR